MTSIVITGASSGLGAALARLYAAPGIRLALLGRNEARLSALAQACELAGAQVATAVLDVADGATMARWIAQFQAEAGIDILIANAGVSAGPGKGAGFEGLTWASRQVATNLLGVMNTVEPALPAMIARRQGQVVIVASVAALKGLPYSPGYCASKAGARAYGESLRPLLAPAGVSVTVVCPGFFASPMTDRWLGPKPFLISTERAAALIHAAIRKKRRRLSFPLPLVFGMRFSDLVPAFLGDLLVRDFRFSIRPPE
jgi:short-subunit dehydrogenase